MLQQSEAKLLVDLTEVPTNWPLETVIYAFVNLAVYYCYDRHDADSSRAREAVSRRVVELWASQSEEGQAWLSRCRERFATELAGKATRAEELEEALLLHGAAEHGKYWDGGWRFSEAGLLRGEPRDSAEELVHKAAWYLRDFVVRACCRELAERLQQAESRAKSAHDATEKQAQDTHCKSQESCGDPAARLEVAEAEAVLHTRTRTKERLAEAESVVAAKQVDLQQLQDKSCSRQEEGGSKAELQLEKAVLQERCEQLRQQLAKAEAKVDLLQGLREEIGTYKERLRGLERQLCETKKKQRLCGGISGHPSQSHPGPARSDVAFGGQEPDLAEQLGYNFVDEDGASVLSGSSSYSVKQDCFMLDAVFKSRMDFFREGRDLQKGSQVLAGDGKTVLEVVEISKEGQATEVVDLQAGAATLRVSPDHPVQIPDESGEPGRHLYMPAGKLKAGDFVMLDSGEPVALTSAEAQPAECEVLKIVFKPDLPVAVFSNPSCILSKGHKKKSQVRRAGGGRGKEAADPMDGGASIPDAAAGEYMD